MKQRMKSWHRMLLALAGICLAAAIFLPIWRIELSAPQYPEGLMMTIHASRLGGDVDIINGLNHYIGMRTLHAADFPEFAFLPYILGFFALASFVVALVGRPKLLMGLLALYAVFAVLAMVDFWKWEYEYGHNLDPSAAIQVPGMTYQPPLFGFKQLLNFGAYSIPAIGGWLMAAAGVLMVAVLFFSLRKKRGDVSLKPMRDSAAVTACVVGLLLFLSACSSGPVPIRVGTDACDYCRMGIADARFGGEVVNKKGKTWKFDDLHCLVGFLKDGTVKQEDVSSIYMTRFDGGHELMPSGKVLLLQSEALHSPMGSNVAAFADRAGIDRAMQQFGGTQISWDALRH
jgi:copper chaperone NosL